MLKFTTEFENFIADAKEKQVEEDKEIKEESEKRREEMISEASTKIIEKRTA